MTVLDCALQYHDRGWTVIPAVDKIPCVKWKRYQTERPTAATVRRWFSSDDRGVAVIFGSASGDLGCRDFDAPGAYEGWAQQYSELAKLLPTAKTPRGHHVYFKAHRDHTMSIRTALEKPDGIGAIDCGDGELRVGVGSYSVLPPTNGYCWIHAPKALIHEVDPVIAGLICPSTPRDRRNEAIAATGSTFTGDIETAVSMAILRTVPTKLRTRYSLLFEFAREMRTLFGADTDLNDLKPYVQQWFKMAKPNIQTQSWSVNWREFRRGYAEVKYIIGSGLATQIYSAAVQRDPPQIADQYFGGDDDHAIWLTQFCRELHEYHQGPFHLDCRTAGRLLGVSHVTANSLLGVLCDDGVIRQESKGTFSSKPGGGKASVFKYLGD